MANQIEEISNISVEEFHNELVPRGKPFVIRGFVNHWPMVQAARTSPEAFCNYVKRFDRGLDLNTVYGPPSTKGRIFYNTDMSDLNSRIEQKKLGASLDFLLKNLNADPAPTLAIQSVVIERYLSGMQLENRLSLVAEKVEPRIWIGNKTTVAAHFDTSDNIACCVAGTRRFTLFPTEQIENLYIGPFEFTPSGATVSMVDFDAPDHTKFPRFQQALDNAYQTDLEPGDIIFIPYMWWHHVKATSAFNALVNYWWTSSKPLFGDPRNAMLYSILALRDLPPQQLEAWKKLFDFYVFNSDPQANKHIPSSARGILGETTSEIIASLKTTLIKALNRIM